MAKKIAADTVEITNPVATETLVAQQTVTVDQLRESIQATNQSNYFVYLVSSPTESFIVPQKSTAMQVARKASETVHKSPEKVIFCKHGMQVTAEQRAANIIVQQHKGLIAKSEVVVVD